MLSRYNPPSSSYIFISWPKTYECAKPTSVLRQACTSLASPFRKQTLIQINPIKTVVTTLTAYLNIKNPSFCSHGLFHAFRIILTTNMSYFLKIWQHSSKWLLVLARTVVLGFELRLNPRPNFCSFQDHLYPIVLHTEHAVCFLWGSKWVH
jgi:hypothetical protein